MAGYRRNLLALGRPIIPFLVGVFSLLIVSLWQVVGWRDLEANRFNPNMGVSRQVIELKRSQAVNAATAKGEQTYTFTIGNLRIFNPNF